MRIRKYDRNTPIQFNFPGGDEPADANFAFRLGKQPANGRIPEGRIDGIAPCDAPGASGDPA